MSNSAAIKSLQLQGPQGSPGVTGATGIQGPTGAPGITGGIGQAGQLGPTGPQGPQGASGIQGVQGSPGITGSTGAQGSPGITGIQGVQGSPGITGVTGQQGIQGIQGSPGITGTQGVQGPTGTQGIQGVTGIQGIQGSPGVTGAVGPVAGANRQVVYNASGSATGYTGFEFNSSAPATLLTPNLTVASAAQVTILNAGTSVKPATGTIRLGDDASIYSLSGVSGPSRIISGAGGANVGDFVLANNIVNLNVGASGALSVLDGTSYTRFSVSPTVANIAVPLGFGSSTNPYIGSTGTIRFPSISSIVAKNDGQTADITLIAKNLNDEVFLGTNTAYGAQASNINTYSMPGGNLYFGNGALTRLAVNSAGVNIYNPGDPLTFGYSGAASIGTIRLPDNSSIVAKGISGGDFNQLSWSSYITQLGILGGSGITLDAASGVMTVYNASQSMFKVFSSNGVAIGTVDANLNFGGGIGVVHIGNAGTLPSANPTAGAVLYSTANTLQYRMPDGQIAVLDSFDISCNGFRLTLTSGTPVPTADVATGGTIYFTPYTSGNIALYDGTNWRMVQSGEISFSLTGYTSITSIYDIFAYRTAANTMALETAVWTNNTTRTTALVRQNGILVKSGAPTRRYVGTFRINAASATSDSAAQRLLYNEYNQVSRTAAYLPSANWTCTSTTIRQANASSLFKIDLVVGNSTQVDINIVSSWTNGGAYLAGMIYYTGIGLGNTTNVGQGQAIQLGTAGWVVAGSANYQGVQSAGFQSYWWLEQAGSATNYPTIYAGTPGLVTSYMKLYVRM